MGHDPTPWIEWAEEIVRVWSDGDFDPAPDAFAIEFERDRFVAELGRVERELRAFLLRVGAWAEAVGFPDPPALCRRLDACFGITEPAAASISSALLNPAISAGSPRPTRSRFKEMVRRLLRLRRAGS